jgi:rhodanese-related sulfurtransferase
MKKQIIWVVSAILLIGILFGVFTRSSAKAEYQALGGTDFLATYQTTAGATMLDVRTPREFVAGHIQGATDVDFENPNFSSEIEKLDKTKPYFVYCRSGNRSGQAVAVMKKQGFQKIIELRGGIVGNQDTLVLTTGTAQ